MVAGMVDSRWLYDMQPPASRGLEQECLLTMIVDLVVVLDGAGIHTLNPYVPFPVVLEYTETTRRQPAEEKP